MSKEWVDYVKDPEMQNIVAMARNIAPRKSSVLIYGESGVGKELLARFIHSNSQRTQGEFVAVNCAAVPENLLESELFGYEKGAFTGAQASKPGKIEKADKGTFLLDEISEMPLLLQGKLLRVIQEAEFERLGSNQTRKIDVRFVCTSNKNLTEMVQRGQFRRDLFYRLNVIPLQIPALRMRKKDINSLIGYFVDKISKENEIAPIEMNKEAMRKLVTWHWPGNIRELQNVLERSILMKGPGEFDASDIKIENFAETTQSQPEKSFIKAGMTIHEAERRLIMKTLEATQQNRTQAAKILGISIRTLRNKLNEYRSHPQNNLEGEY